MKQRRKQADHHDNNNNSDDDDYCSKPNSQEMVIGDILDQEAALGDLREIYNQSMKKAKQFSADGGGGGNASNV